MANQIKKKYIENDAIDGLKLLLQSDQTLRRLLEDGTTQDVIAHLEGLVSDEETRALAAESGLDTRITSLESQVGDDLQAAISQLQAEIAQEASDRESADNGLQDQITQEISDRQSAISSVQSQITSLEGAEDVLFEDNTGVYADGTAGVEDPTGRDGWYYKSAGSPEKINWYFHDGQTTQVTVGQWDRLYTVATVDSSSNDTFHLSYYTFPLGDGQDAGSWYRSRIVYVPSGNFERGVKTLFYMGQEPDASVYPDLPRVQMTVTTVPGSSVGLNADTEVIFTAVFGTNSAADAGSVELLVNKLGFNSSVYNKEYSLEIRGEFTLAGVKQSLLEEAIARQNADGQLQDNIDVEKARIDSILSGASADLDTFSEVVALINSVDTTNDQTFAGYVLSNDAALAQEVSDREAADNTLQDSIEDEERDRINADNTLQANINIEKARIDAILGSTERQDAEAALDARIVELENSSDVIEIDSLASAPTLGLQGKLYVAKDSNKLYRWATTSGGSLDFDLTVGSGEEYETLESAIAAASNGQNILVKAGTYLVSSTINVNKELKIVGEDADTVIFETAGETSDPVVMFNFSANNSAIAKMTVKHKKPNNTSVETAIVASGGGFPQTRVSNFIVEDCKIEYAEFGVVVRAEDWCVRDSQFTYATGSGSNSNRCVGIYGTKGNSYIKDNFLKNDVLNGTSFRPFYLTSTTGSNPNETVEGKLVIEGTTHVGALAQFFNQDNTQSAGAGTFELQIKDNVINETNLFAGVACYVENAGDLFSSITLSGNTLSNLHAADGGKGVYGVYGVAAFRSSPLVVHASNNTLGQEVFRTGWESVEGSLIGKETAVPAFSVSLDSVIPASGDAPSVSGGSTSEYVEVSEQADLTGIESDITSLDARLDALEGISFEKENFVISAQDVANGYIDLQNEVIAKSLRLHVGRLAGFEGEDYSVSVVGGVTRITFIGSFASGGAEAMAEGDKVKVAYSH